MDQHFKFDIRRRLAFGIATPVIAAFAMARSHELSDHPAGNHAITMLDPQARAATRNEGARSHAHENPVQ